MPPPRLMRFDERQCWVPNCKNWGTNRRYIPMPKDLFSRELWVALAGRKFPPHDQVILFCEDHFKPSVLNLLENNTAYLRTVDAAPTRNMPDLMCRTCMKILGDPELFHVLSGVIPSAIPRDINVDLTECRPEPLYQILAFCMPDLNISQDPPALVCSKCYRNIWMYFVYKLTCNKVEKELCANLPPAQYGKMIMCRSCPQTTSTSFFVLSEDSLKGKLLRKMFLNDFPTEVVPLKICLKCWNVLYKLEVFYEQCHATDQKLERRNSPSQSTSNNDLHCLVPCGSNGRTDSHTAGSYLQPMLNKDPVPCTSGRGTDLSIKPNIQSGIRDSLIGKHYPNGTIPPKIYNLTQKAGVQQASALSELAIQDKKGTITGATSDLKGAIPNWHLPVANAPALCTKEDPALSKATQSHLNSMRVSKSTGTCWPLSTQTFSQANVSVKDPRVSGPTQSKSRVPPVAKQKMEATSPPKPSTTNKHSRAASKPYSIQERIALVKLKMKYDKADISTIVKEMKRQGYTRTGPSIQKIWSLMINGFDVYRLKPPSSLGVKILKELIIAYINREKGSTERGAVNDVASNEKAIVSRSTTNKNVGPSKHYSVEERIALAELMLKYGKKEFSTVVTEMQQQGYNRNSRSLLKSWSLIKNSNGSSSLGHSQTDRQSYLNELIVAYKRNVKRATESNAVNAVDCDCDVICVDDHVAEVAREASKEKRIISRPASPQAPNKSAVTQPTQKVVTQEAVVPANKKVGRPKDTSKNKHLNTKSNFFPNKKRMAKAKLRQKVTKKARLHPMLAKARTRWTYEYKLAFARIVRKEYDEYMTDTATSTAMRTPWKAIMERLASKGYHGGKASKLYSMWSVIKKSATIHEKNGLDQVDEEVWDMLQLHSGVCRSLPQALDYKKIKAGPSTADSNRIPPAPAKMLKTSSAIVGGSNVSASGNKSDSDSSTLKKPGTINKAPNRVPPSERSAERNVISGHRMLYHILSTSEKLHFLDLCEQEIKTLLDKKISSKKFLQLVCERLQKRAYKEYTLKQVYFLCSQLRRNATLRKLKCRQAPLSIQKLDCKVAQIHTLCAKVINKTHASKNKSLNRIRDRDALVWGDKGNKKKCKSAWSETEKTALISVVRSYGNEVFKQADNRDQKFWFKIRKDFCALGFNRVTSSIQPQWNTCLASAKKAWAHQKEATSHDECIIDFMTEVIHRKDTETSNKYGRIENKEGTDSSCDKSEIEEKQRPNEDSRAVDDALVADNEASSSDTEIDNSEFKDDDVEDTVKEGSDVEMDNTELKDNDVEDTVRDVCTDESSGNDSSTEDKKSDIIKFEPKDCEIGAILKEESSQDDDVVLKYEYVSVDDIQREYGINIIGPKEEDPTEVIQILDSDDE